MQAIIALTFMPEIIFRCCHSHPHEMQALYSVAVHNWAEWLLGRKAIMPSTIAFAGVIIHRHSTSARDFVCGKSPIKSVSARYREGRMIIIRKMLLTCMANV